MGLRSWFADPLGLKAQAASQRELINQVLRVTQEQTLAASKMVDVLDRLYAATQTDGTPPEGRHFTDQWEAEMWDEQHGN